MPVRLADRHFFIHQFKLVKVLTRLNANLRGQPPTVLPIYHRDDALSFIDVETPVFRSFQPGLALLPYEY